MLMRVVAWCVLGVLPLACGPADHPPQNPRMAAHVGDHRITEADLDAAWRERKPGEYARARQNTYRMRRGVLDDLIADALVADEVARFNRSEPVLLRLAVESGLLAAEPPVDEAQIEALYEQSGAAEYGIRLDTLRQEFVAVLEEQRAAATRDRYREHLRASADVRILLDPPRASIPVTPADPARGTPHAPIQIVEFSDFHCRFCRLSRPVMEQLLDKYGDQVQWIWKDYPLGPAAAAVAAACAHEQGAFWDYHDALFDRQGQIAAHESAVLQALARELELDEVGFAACMADVRHHDQVSSDATAGAAAGVTGTPTMFVNGRMIAGAQAFEDLERLVLDELELVNGGRR